MIQILDCYRFHGDLTLQETGEGVKESRHDLHGKFEDISRVDICLVIWLEGRYFERSYESVDGRKIQISEYVWRQCCLRQVWLPHSCRGYQDLLIFFHFRDNTKKIYTNHTREEPHLTS